MAPWEELPFFDLVREVSVSGSVLGTQIVGGDPMRIVLAFSALPGASVGFVTTKPNPSSNSGLSLGTALPLILTAKDHPRLCQSAWYVGATSAGSYTALTVSMLKWPQLPPAVQRRYRQAYPDSRIKEIMGDVPE